LSATHAGHAGTGGKADCSQSQEGITKQKTEEALRS